MIRCCYLERICGNLFVHICIDTWSKFWNSLVNNQIPLLCFQILESLGRKWMAIVMAAEIVVYSVFQWLRHLNIRVNVDVMGFFCGTSFTLEHFSRLPSLHGSTLAWAKREILYEIWQIDTKEERGAILLCVLRLLRAQGTAHLLTNLLAQGSLLASGNSRSCHSFRFRFSTSWARCVFRSVLEMVRDWHGFQSVLMGSI